MAQLISVKLSRFDACPWGFRLQGGKDFGAPLLIQKVNGGSPAEKAGLQAGDAVMRVNDVELFHLRHKEAQDCIVRAGNNFELTVQRGGSTWKPQVTPVGPAPVNYNAAPNVQPVTKTSLAAKKQEAPQIGSGHNFAPKPFAAPQVNGIGDQTVKSIVNKQYNTPVGIYSEETIAETLSAQAEVLAGGVLGVNFKKNERTYNAANSEVLKMVQEIDSEPREAEPEPMVGGSVTSPPVTGLRHVSAPETKPTPTTPHEDPFKTLPPGQNICADCERLIVGVFVRIKDKNLHVECFKCATCGTSLKNVGYYNINNKLYCDIHAKLVARQNPPAPNLEPITIPPGGRAPAGAISAALAKAPISPASNFAPASPSNFAPALPSSNFAPAPARAPTAPVSTLTRAPAPVMAPAPAPAPAPVPAPAPAPSSLAGPKPFSTPSAPVTNPTRAAPAGSKFVWPPTRTEEDVSSSPTATPLYIPPSQTSGPGTPTGQSAPKIPPFAAVKSVSAPVNVSASGPIPTPAPAPVPIFVPPPQAAPLPSFQPVVVPSIPAPSSHQTAPFPQPFSVFLSKHQPPMKRVASPAPLIQPTPQMSIHLPDVKPVPYEDSLTEEVKSGIHKKFSVCSQEVYSINVDKPAPKFETLSEALETQMLVTSLTPEPVMRPESPVPMQDRVASSMQDIALTGDVASNPQEQVKTVATETVSASESNVEATNPSDDNPSGLSAPSEMQPPRPESVLEFTQSIEKLESELLSASSHLQNMNISEQSISTQQTELTFSEMQSSSSKVTVESQSEVISQQATFSETQMSNQMSTQSVSGFVPVSREQEYSATQFQQQTRQISSQQSSSLTSAATALSTSIEPYYPLPTFAQDRAGACASPLLSALTIAPDQPYSPLAYATKPMGPASVQAPSYNTQAPINRETACASPLLSALIIASDRPYSPLPSATKPMAPAPIQSAPINTQAYAPIVNPAPLPLPPNMQPQQNQPPVMKPIAPAPLPANIQNREAACSSPMLAALTIASNRPYSPLPSATKPLMSASVQSAPVNVQAALPVAPKPMAPAPIPSTVQAPLARGAAYPSVIKPAPLPLPPNMQTPESQPVTVTPVLSAPVPTSTQIPLNREAACPSPMLTALTIASDRPYSPLPSATKTSDFTASPSAPKPSNIPFPGAIKVLPTTIKPPVAEQPLRDETQPPLLSKPSHQVSMTSALTTASVHPYSPFPSATQAPILPISTKPEIRPTKVTPKQPVSASALPVIGGFRQIVSVGFKPIPSDDIPRKEPYSSFPPISDELKAEFGISPAPRPQTPIQRVSTPTSHSRSGTPQQKQFTASGLHKPATIPPYQQQMGEYSGQRPRSATPTCPMTIPQPHTPQFQLTKPETPYVPQKPSALFQRQPPPQKPYAGYEPQPVLPKSTQPQPQPQLPPEPVPQVTQIPAQQVVQQPTQPETQQASIPFPNIPLPEGFKAEPLSFKPVSSPTVPSYVPQQSTQKTSVPVYKPSPLAATVQSEPIIKPSPLVSAPVPKPALSQPAPPAPQPSSAPVPAIPKTVPITATQPAKTPSTPSSSSVPNAGGGGGGAPGGAQKGSAVAGSTAPRRGRGVLTQQSAVPGGRIPLCAHCNSQIRGPFITALGKNWCPEHFVCVNAQCRRPLADIGFVEEKGELYCEYCFEKYLAPTCDKCSKKIKGDCLNAIGKHFHPECFLCAYCGKLFGNNPFFLEDGLPYCESDWNELFTTKCFACGFPIEAGDRWVEALSNNYHSQCFNCTNCKKNLEGQSFYAKGGRPFCKTHAR